MARVWLYDRTKSTAYSGLVTRAKSAGRKP